MAANLGNDWDKLLFDEWGKEYYVKMREFLKKEYFSKTVYPLAANVLNALRLTSYADTKVVILGQDPYHGEGQAHGLAFSVVDGIPLPPSLKNIYKEIESETGCKMPGSGDLTRWARQGVLLLNSVLTVEAGKAFSHSECGWQRFTDRILELLNKREEPVVFLLWGASAKKKAQIVTSPQHIVLTAAHPSPLSAYNGFFGCGHFVKANEKLRMLGREEISW